MYHNPVYRKEAKNVMLKCKQHSKGQTGELVHYSKVEKVRLFETEPDRGRNQRAARNRQSPQRACKIQTHLPAKKGKIQETQGWKSEQQCLLVCLHLIFFFFYSIVFWFWEQFFQDWNIVLNSEQQINTLWDKLVIQHSGAFGGKGARLFPQELVHRVKKLWGKKGILK